MKKLLSIIILALLLAFAVSAETLTYTDFRIGTADPWFFHYDGKYYLTKSGESRVAVYFGENLADVDDEFNKTGDEDIVYIANHDGTVDPTIKALFGEGATINGTWSPEIHYFSEEEMGENAGWYMYLALHKKNDVTNDASRYVRMVVLKSRTDDPFGPYGNPTVLDEDDLPTANYSQPLLEMDGSVYGTKKYAETGDTSDLWACGQTILRINEGPYKGIYTMWVSETGRNIRTKGEFYQNIMIAKLDTPWQLGSAPVAIISADQPWEKSSATASNGKPEVVEGATPIYGKNGEIYLIYSGSGYWTDYALGQVKWNGGDPCNASSWEKLSVADGNPIFDSNDTTFMTGAGHASFITDANGNGFAVYHAYHGDKSRGSFIEPYEIDYEADIVRIGLTPGVPTNPERIVNMEFTTVADGGVYLTTPEVYALGRTFSVTLTMQEDNAEGFIIYRSEDGEVYDYLTTVTGTSYTDLDVVENRTYYYHVYPYRNEEIGKTYAEVSQKATTYAPSVLAASAENEVVSVMVYANDNYDAVRLYRRADGVQFGTGVLEQENVSNGSIFILNDTVTEVGTYEYMVTGINNGVEYFPASTVTVTVEYVTPTITPPTIFDIKQSLSEQVRIEVAANADYDGGMRIYHSEDGVTFEQAVRAALDVPVSEGGCAYLSVGNLSAGTHYFYAVGVVNGVESAPSEVRSFDVVSLNAPVFTEITATCEGITMTYGGEEAYDSYTVYRIVSVVDEYFGELLESQEIATTTESTYTLTDITLGEEYLFGVKGKVNGISTATSTAAFRVTPAHTVVEEDGIAPTCTEAGHEKYAICSVCKTVLGEIVSIPALGHSYALTEEEIPATTEAEGKTAVYTCAACGETSGGEVIPKLEKPLHPGSGDANGDGKVNLFDILRILHYIQDSADFPADADKSGDGKLTVLDALLTLQAYLNGEV